MKKIKFEYKITGLYLTIGFLWILFSDKFLLLFFKDGELLTDLQTYKGWFYVLFTGVLLYSFLKKHLEKMRNAENKAKENDRLKTAFIQNISHEIRTPMNGIIGFSNLLHDPDLTDEQKSFYLDIITNSSTQLLKIVNEVLDISLIESGIANEYKNSIHLNNFLQEIFVSFAPEVKKEISFSVEKGLSDEDCVILTDEIKLKYILTNLLSNANKFTEKGVIRFGYVFQGREIEFFVEDTGIGIDTALNERIFERFFQVEKDINKLYGGVGLGLSICKGNVDLLKGRIWLKSVLGKGSVFFFTIPYIKSIPKETIVHQKAKTTEKHTGASILIVEDEESNIQYINEILSKSGFELLYAENGKIAVEISNTKKIDLVLMDIKMPIMDGYEATKKIRESHPNLPIIAQTAFAHPEEKEEALNSGCTDYISKPFQRGELLQIIEKYLGKN